MDPKQPLEVVDYNYCCGARRDDDRAAGVAIYLRMGKTTRRPHHVPVWDVPLFRLHASVLSPADGICRHPGRNHENHKPGNTNVAVLGMTL